MKSNVSRVCSVFAFEPPRPRAGHLPEFESEGMRIWAPNPFDSRPIVLLSIVPAAGPWALVVDRGGPAAHVGVCICICICICVRCRCRGWACSLSVPYYSPAVR